jgi:hypothetical protein
VAQGDVAGEDGQGLLGDGQAAQVQEGQAELVGEGAGDLDLVGQAEGGDDLAQASAAALVLTLDAQGLLQLRLGEDLAGHQHLAEPATPARGPRQRPSPCPSPSRRFSPLLVAPVQVLSAAGASR